MSTREEVIKECMRLEGVFKERKNLCGQIPLHSLSTFRAKNVVVRTIPHCTVTGTPTVSDVVTVQTLIENYLSNPRMWSPLELIQIIEDEVWTPQ